MPETPTLSGYQLPPLPWLRAFEAAARHASFTAAAEELNLTQAAVSHQVRSLEKHLGVVLFERLPRSLRLTEIGVAYLPPLRRAFGELAAATTGLFGTVGKRTLTVRAPVSFLSLWLAPRLPAFARAHPDISLRLTSVVWTHSDSDEAADIDIRYGDGIWPGSNALVLQHSAAVAVCHPDLAPARPGHAGIAALLTRAPLIHITGYEDLWQRLLKPMGFDLPSFDGINVDTSVGGLELALAGMGPVIVLSCLAEGALASGRLVQCIAETVPMDQAHYLLTAEGRTRPNADAARFRAWLIEAAGDAGQPAA